MHDSSISRDIKYIKRVSSSVVFFDISWAGLVFFLQFLKNNKYGL